jgi:solute carrier family 25 phosphate transporter 23/24/25/41
LPLVNNQRQAAVTVGMKGSNHNYSGTIDAIAKMVQKEGLSSFYKGLIPNYLKVIPTIAISFATYEYTKSLL